MTGVGTDRMGFSFSECSLIQMGQNNVKYIYYMDQKNLESTDGGKDLGVLLPDDRLALDL